VRDIYFINGMALKLRKYLAMKTITIDSVKDKK
jgi:hypothetical protein